jgi:predicted PurR-regulated permease PerM
MHFIYFTVIALLLYLLSDWTLQQVERRYGRRFAQRELIFFLILAILSVVSFTLIRNFS